MTNDQLLSPSNKKICVLSPKYIQPRNMFSDRFFTPCLLRVLSGRRLELLQNLNKKNTDILITAEQATWEKRSENIPNRATDWDPWLDWSPKNPKREVCKKPWEKTGRTSGQMQSSLTLLNLWVCQFREMFYILSGRLGILICGKKSTWRDQAEQTGRLDRRSAGSFTFMWNDLDSLWSSAGRSASNQGADLIILKMRRGFESWSNFIHIESMGDCDVLEDCRGSWSVQNRSAHGNCIHGDLIDLRCLVQW